MKNATMLYKAPGPHEIHGGHFDYIIVDADEDGAIEAAKSDGWFETTTAAKASFDASKMVEPPSAPSDLDSAPPTRAELEQKANELGIKFDGRTTDKKLGEMIQTALES